MRRILIFSNLPQRDLPCDTLLAEHLRNLGNDVRQGPLNLNNCDIRQTNFLPDPRSHILFYKPDIVIGPEARCQFTVDFYRCCHEWGIQTVAKRTEMGTCWDAWNVMGDDEKKTVIGAWEYYVDLELAWSQDFADLLEKHGYIPKNNIYAAGYMPSDVYFRPPFPERPKERRNIMIATGWSHADTNATYNVPEAPVGSSVHADAYNRHRTGREKYIELVERLYSELSSNWNIFLSLKVGEQPEEYMKRLGNKMKIYTPAHAKVTLSNTDLLIHPCSSMAIGSHLMRVPGIAYMGQLNQTKGYTIPSIHPYTEDVNEVVKMVKEMDLTKSNADVGIIKKLEKEMYGVIDGDSCKRAAQKILSLPQTKTNIPDVWPAEKKEYSHPGVSKNMVNWICETCKKPNYTLDPNLTMIMCVNCAISLARRGPLVPQSIQPNS